MDDPILFPDRLEELPNIAQRPRGLHDAWTEALSLPEMRMRVRPLGKYAMWAQSSPLSFPSLGSPLCQFVYAQSLPSAHANVVLDSRW